MTWQISIYNVQRAGTPKVDKQELWFLCSACYISIKFQENILNSFQVTEQFDYVGA